MSFKTSYFLFTLTLFLCLILPAFSVPQTNQYTLDSATLFKETLEYDRAISILESEKGLANSLQSKALLGKLYFLKGNSSKALKILESIGKKKWWVYVYLGLIFESLDEPAQARQSYLKSIQLHNNGIALYRLGKIYYQEKN